MAPKAHSLGRAQTYVHPGTGLLLVDTNSLKDGDFAGDVAEDSEEFGEDDDSEEFGEDDDDDDGDVEVGRGRGRARRKKRRAKRQDRRQTRRAKRRGEDDDDDDDDDERKPKDNWSRTMLSGTVRVEQKGRAIITIRPQHDFHAEDALFDGSIEGATVHLIKFGRKIAWDSPTGVNVAVLSSRSMARQNLVGNYIKGGLDIVVEGEVPEAGDFAVTFIGRMPSQSCR